MKWRTRTRDLVPLPPCQEACPIHQDTRGYVGLIAKGKYREALELIREVNPLLRSADLSATTLARRPA